MDSLFAMPPNISVWGANVDRLFWVSVYLTSAAALAVVAALVYILITYRERPGSRAYYTHGDQRIHMLITGGLSLVLFVGLDFRLENGSRRAFQEYLESYPRGTDAIRVEVRGEQFTWKCRYPGPDGKFKTDDDVWYPAFKVPVDTDVVVELTSRDVIHSFFLPNVRIKQDAVPGLVTSLWFRTRPGTEGDYEVGCAELCGNGHTRMRIQFQVMARKDYDDWLAGLYEKHKAGKMGEEADGNWGWDWRGR